MVLCHFHCSYGTGEQTTGAEVGYSDLLEHSAEAPGITGPLRLHPLSLFLSPNKLPISWSRQLQTRGQVKTAMR